MLVTAECASCRLAVILFAPTDSSAVWCLDLYLAGHNQVCSINLIRAVCVCVILNKVAAMYHVATFHAFYSANNELGLS